MVNFLAVKGWPYNKTVRREKLSTPAGRTCNTGRPSGTGQLPKTGQPQGGCPWAGGPHGSGMPHSGRFCRTGGRKRRAEPCIKNRSGLFLVQQQHEHPRQGAWRVPVIDRLYGLAGVHGYGACPGGLVRGITPGPGREA